jgi:uncharacterized protein GlcG (DUF336 family)
MPSNWPLPMLADGVPILVDHEIIGVAGSPGSRHDEECADTAIAHIASGLK